MQQLHLVGLTTDLDSIICSARKGAKSGSFALPLNEHLLQVIAEAVSRRNADGVDLEVPEALQPPTAAAPRRQSHLSPREIQDRLRAGRSMEEIAVEAGVGEEWVARFAAPVEAERSQVVGRARRLTYYRPRRGDSGEPLGMAVRWNLADRGVRLANDEFDAAWSAYQLADTAWMVTFRYEARKREHEAEWEVDLATNELLSRNRLATELGYVEPGRRRRPVASLQPVASAAAVRARAQETASSASSAAGPDDAAVAPARRTPTAPGRGAARKAPAGRGGAKKASAGRGVKKVSSAGRGAAKKASSARAAVKKASSARPAVKKASSGRGAAKKVSSAGRGGPTKASAGRGAVKKASAGRGAATKRASAASKSAKKAAPARGGANKASSARSAANKRTTPTRPPAKAASVRASAKRAPSPPVAPRARTTKKATAKRPAAATTSRRAPATKASGRSTTRRTGRGVPRGQTPPVPVGVVDDRPVPNELGRRRLQLVAGTGPARRVGTGVRQAAASPMPGVRIAAARSGDVAAAQGQAPRLERSPRSAPVAAPQETLAPEPGLDVGVDVGDSEAAAEARRAERRRARAAARGWGDGAEPARAPVRSASPAEDDDGRVVTIRANRARPPQGDAELVLPAERPPLRPAQPAAQPRKRRFNRNAR